MVKYANMLINGEGCEKNEEEAIKLFKLASDYGNKKKMAKDVLLNLQLMKEVLMQCMNMLKCLVR